MRIIRELLAWRPPYFSSGESLWQRALFAYVILTIGFKNLNYNSQPFPVGLARFFDFSFYGNDATYAILEKFMLPVAIVWVLGFLPIVSLAYIFFVCLSFGTLINSQGTRYHGTQIITLPLMLMLIAYLMHWWQSPNKLRNFFFAEEKMQHKGSWYALQAIAAAYFLPGIWKLWRSGINWFIDLPNISVQITKSAWQKYYQNIDESVRDHAIEYARLILEWPNFFRLLMGIGLVGEVLAFLALFNRRMSFVIGVSMLGLHLSVIYMMKLTFPQNMAILSIFLICAPFFQRKISWFKGLILAACHLAIIIFADERLARGLVNASEFTQKLFGGKTVHVYPLWIILPLLIIALVFGFGRKKADTKIN